ncbi:hypothetical protein DJ73_15255 [Halorubrum sp. Ea1]|uniref:hypothetical protein n=1 Tax=Halorubrum sp. Ea1 TaxID=1480718 RepID=UPI000B980A43|nr:hypothetical protein [Halorubrum sp. Ea1]OYR46149.1 hypothetical protein DJ81_03580 [Halorubrum sp. Hd13]OYR50651.1 hypothetical protein DJ73_15255 [Halorubrum sp. Ea1]
MAVNERAVTSHHRSDDPGDTVLIKRPEVGHLSRILLLFGVKSGPLDVPDERTVVGPNPDGDQLVVAVDREVVEEHL